MYTQLIQFILALALFSLQEPGAQELRPFGETLFLSAITFGFYVLVCRLTFRSLRRAFERGYSSTYISIKYDRAVSRLSILALLNLAMQVYVLNIKYYLRVLPGFDQSAAISGTVGLILYLLHLGTIWYNGYDVEKARGAVSGSRLRYVRSQAGFYVALLIPWLIISALSDITFALELPGFMGGELGDSLLTLLLLLAFVLFAPMLVVKLWGCRSLEPGTARRQLENFCGEQRFNVRDFLVWRLPQGDMPTAAIMGILPRLRYILVTPALLALLDYDELKAVAAHEMGHIRRYHMPLFLVFFFCYSFVAYSLHDLILLMLMRSDTVFRWAVSADSTSLTLFSIIYAIPILVMLFVYFRYIFGFFLRNCERQADVYALRMIGHPYTLISSLRKIAVRAGNIEDVPNWHHFSIRQRIDFLMASHENPNLARAHDLKLYKWSGIFVLAVLIVSTVGLQIRGSDMVRSWQDELQVKALEAKLESEPGNSELYGDLGGLLYERKRYREAVAFLEKALEIDPRNATALNNLAWLRATVEGPLRNPKEALRLAREAVEEDPRAHVLDTLAEACYINGRHREALDAINRALALHPDNLEYYQKQKERFQKALEGD